MNHTSTLLRTLKSRKIASLLIESALGFLAASTAAVIAAALGDYLLTVAFPTGGILCGLVILIAALKAYTFIKALKDGFVSDERMLLGLGKAHPEFNDELISAWQLSKNVPPGVSLELTALLIEKTEEAAGRIDPPKEINIIGPGTPKLARTLSLLILAAAALYVIPPHLMKSSLKHLTQLSAYSDWSKWFDVSPGSGQLPWGSPVEIKVVSKSVIRGRPVILVRSEDGGRFKEEMEASGPGTFVYRAEKLVSRISYRINWAEFRTGEFSILPVEVPRLGDFTLNYVYPDYTGMGPRTAKGSPSVSALAGTKVSISARSTKTLKSTGIRTSWRSDAFAGADRQNVRASFTVSQNGVYRIDVAALDGSFDPEPEEYPVTVISDQPPRVELLSPADDLVAADNAEIPVVARVEDDFGITEVELVYKDGRGAEGRVNIGGELKGAARGDVEYLWKLSSLNPRPGDRISYHVEARDNDTTGGPKTAASRPLVIDINDYAREHEKIEKGLKEMRDDLLGLLADQNESRKKLKSIENVFSTAAYSGALAAQAGIEEKVKSPIEKLGKSLESMENDPYTDPSTRTEYKGLQSHLEYLRDNQMNGAVEALSKKDMKEAARDEDEIASSLEKMALLSEDIWQYQRMKDLFNTGEDLKKASKDLAEQLAGNPRGRELEEQLKKLDGLLEKINNQISKLPKELPEDFVNSRAVKNINMATYADTINKIREAASKGDWKKAQELAAELQKSLEDMAGSLDTAGSEIGFSKDRDDELSKNIQDYGSRLEGLIAGQRSWLESARSADEGRKRELFAKQEEMLRGLYDKQKKLNAMGVSAKYVLSKDFRGYYNTYSVDQSLNLMGKVLDEFRAVRAFNSQKYLGDIIEDWTEIQGPVNSARNVAPETKRPVEALLRDLVSGEKEILNILKKGIDESSLPQPSAGKLSTLSKEETSLGARAFALHSDMQKFTRKSTALGPEAFGNIADAAGEMTKAAGQIGKMDSSAAVGSGERALELLTSGQSELMKAAGTLSEMKGGSGKKISGAVQIRQKNLYGLRTAAVRLPGKDEYKPPKEFRQEIMDALREKYPQKFDRMIKEYYRRLTE